MRTLSLNVCGTELTTFMSEQDGDQFVALKPLCEAIGINFEKQRQKLQRNPQFSVVVLKHNSSTVVDKHNGSVASHKVGNSTTSHKVGGSNSPDGKNYEMVCLPVRELGMWICNINANRVNPEIKDTVLKFQKYLQEVIYQALFNGVTPERFQMMEEKLNSLMEIVLQEREEKKILQQEVLRLNGIVENQASFQASLGSKAMLNKRWNSNKTKVL